MKKLLESWKKFLTEEKQTINTKAELIDLLKKDPDQKIFLDSPKGTTKKFGGVDPIELPFDYGEYSELTNPADGMGWDIIIIPGSTENDKNLTPVGHVSYTGDQEEWSKNTTRNMPSDLKNNHKIFIAAGGEYSAEGKKVIEDFFKERWQFGDPEWYL
tara:strand:+ start:1069 stop:1542 length:474 start_codon:yes stop_codon:yes gene_type:complete